MPRRPPLLAPVRSLTACTAAALSIGGAWAPAPSLAQPAPTAPDLAVPDRPTAISLELNQTPLRTALDGFARVSGRNVAVVWSALQREGVDPEAPVSIRVAGASPTAVLRLMLDQAEDLAGPPPLGPDGLPMPAARVRLLAEPTTDGGYEIMTRAMANRQTEVRVYPLGDLGVDVPTFIAPTLGISTGSGSGSGGSRIELDVDTTDDRDEDRQGRRPGDDVAELIRQSVEPELWRANGGSVASVAVYQNSLVIRAPAYVHRRIGVGQAPPDRYAAPSVNGKPASPSGSASVASNPDRPAPARRSPGGVSSVHERQDAQPVGAAR
ncbi:MAG: hypothetical protein AAF288_03800 [Planctomycetota bacterium]